MNTVVNQTREYWCESDTWILWGIGYVNTVVNRTREYCCESDTWILLRIGHVNTDVNRTREYCCESDTWILMWIGHVNTDVNRTREYCCESDKSDTWIKLRMYIYKVTCDYFFSPFNDVIFLDLKPKVASQLPPGLPAYFLFMLIRHLDHINDEKNVRTLIQVQKIQGEPINCGIWRRLLGSSYDS